MAEEAVAHGAGKAAWCSSQLDAAGWTTGEGAGVRYIADQLLGLGVLRTHGDTPEFELALDIVYELLHGRALGPEHWSTEKRAADEDSRAVWIKVQPGQALNRQDRVRVRSDAYADGPQRQHNGRTGRVMGVRYGMAVVHYDGDPPGTGHHHNIRLLEKRTVQ